jgi:hypothetical protein
VDGLLGPLVLVAIGVGMVIAPSINTGTFGVGPQDAGVASATVGQQLGASVGTSLLNTIFASAATSCLAVHLASTQIGRQTLTELALAHAYDTTFWWTAGFFAAGAVIGGALLRRGPLAQSGNPSSARGGVPTAPAEAGPGHLNVQA